MYKNSRWPLTLYFEGECPLCAREIKLLSARAIPDRLLFVDISDAAFDANALGFTRAQMEASLRARFDDGTWVTGLDATLWSWRAAGLGIWAAPLSWRLTRPFLNVGYRLFCRWRPHLAWLPHPDGSVRCRGGRCAVPAPQTTPGSRTSPVRVIDEER
ncbi:thiol-disulfide oxidoreductase DCC family protein [Pseudomonas sp. RA_5y_Pfl1_P24]|uniref:thiol-disulfide oxidoreductase DCC family protein n=1 Tax=Pseudomonas sp. RA_5y_Pfl1_P24 TaxID=3088706 RepID=UPI0030D7C921